MPQLKVELNIDEIKDLIFQLSPSDFIQLVWEIKGRLETLEMMKLAESGFEEWHEAEEDIYGKDPES